ncbi:MAG TPA: CPBP family intramembrane glutamic endopeptidase [Bauldia sp.]|nr:CPBP family intramembrane glutamic endopeptidase [Bauldia sp.]
MGAYAALAVAATVILYGLYYLLISSQTIRARRGSIAGVVAKRLSGVLVLGLLPAVLIAAFLPFTLVEVGLTAEVPDRTWLWVAGASLVIVPACFATAHKPANFDVYPEMRTAEWGPGAVAANSLSSALYMFAYEFLFRGILLFPCLAALPTGWAIAINVALYALAHVPKGPREALGSIPLGIVLCLATIDTGAIWAAFLIHSIMSQLNDYLAVRANPEMRFSFKGLSE